MMNFLGVIFLFLLVMLSYFPSIDVNGAARKAVFSALVGVGAGGITGANIVLDFIALVFHDINSMTGVFIHVVSFRSLRWARDCHFADDGYYQS